MTLSGELAAYGANTTFEQLPDEVVERTKLVVFDEVACALVGRARLAGRLSAKYVLEFGGSAEATVVGTSRKVPAPLAALANGTAGHADEFDGAHVSGGHPGAVIVHAALAVAESEGSTGADLINAVVLGFDIGTRLVESVGGISAMKKRMGLHSDFLHAFGVAAASARLMGLDERRHRYAAALTSFQSIGHSALFEERRHLSNSFASGQAAYAGVSGARLARTGFEGNESIFDAEHGVLRAWSEEGRERTLVRGLGSEFAIMTSNFKFYNAGYVIHAPVEAAVSLINAYGLGAQEIAAVNVRMPSAAVDVVNNRPVASISLQDTLAFAMLGGKLNFRDSDFAALRTDPMFRRLRDSISVAGDPEFDRQGPATRGAIVEIVTSAGTSLSERVEHPRGHTYREQVQWAHLYEKWAELLEPGLGQGGWARYQTLMSSLETIQDVAQLSHLLQQWNVEALQAS